MDASQKRCVIEGVPRVAFAPIHDGKWEFTPYPSCLKAILTRIGQPHPYHYLLGASGAAFRMVWNSREWDGGNVDIVFMDPEPFRPHSQALKAAGYTGRILLNPATTWGSAHKNLSGRDRALAEYFADDPAIIRAAIVESIQAGRVRVPRRTPGL